MQQCPSHKRPTHRSGHSSPPHHPLWLWSLFPYQTLATHSTVTSPLAHNAPWSPGNGDALCSILYTASHTQESKQHRSSSLSGLCGLVSMPMCRCRDTLSPNFLPSPFLMPGSTSSTLIWSDHFHRHVGSPGGQKQLPITTITAEAVAQAFLSGWIARFGVPSTIVTDRGRQFESHLWDALMTLLGSKRARTTAYHPEANGMVERFHAS